MIDYTVFDASGRILQTGLVLEEQVSLQGAPAEGRFVLIGAGQTDEHWVWNGNVIARPTMPFSATRTEVLANGTDEVELSGALAGATVSVAGPTSMRAEVDGSPITLTFALPGRYDITVSLFPFQDSKVTINAI